MGVINKSTEEINGLLDKVENMPEEVVDGKTPVLETGETTTLEPGQNATSEVIPNGSDESGNPKYKLNFGIPRGMAGEGGGEGGTADSVEWKNVFNKPSWVNSSTKPTYTAAEVGALPDTTKIPSKTSELENDSTFVKSTELRTINGQSIVGSGNIEIPGSSTGGTGNGNVNVTNASSLKKGSGYIFHPSGNGSTTGEFKEIPYASESNPGLMDSDMFQKISSLPSVIKFITAFGELSEESTGDEIFSAINTSLKNTYQQDSDFSKEQVAYFLSLIALRISSEYSEGANKFYIGTKECLHYGSVDAENNTSSNEFTYIIAGGRLKSIIVGVSEQNVVDESGLQNTTYTFTCKTYIDYDSVVISHSANTIPKDGDVVSISKEKRNSIADAIKNGKEIVVRTLCSIFKCVTILTGTDSDYETSLSLYFEFYGRQITESDIGLPFVSGCVDIPGLSNMNEEGTYTCTFHIHSYRFVMDIDLSVATIGGTALNRGFGNIIDFCKTNKTIFGRLSNDSTSLIRFDVEHIDSNNDYPIILKSNIPIHSGGVEGLKNYELVISAPNQGTLYLIGDSTEAPMDGNYYVRKNGKWISLAVALEEISTGMSPSTAENGVYILCDNGMLYTRSEWTMKKYTPIGVAVITEEAKFAVAMENIEEQYPWCPLDVTPSVISGIAVCNTAGEAKQDFSGFENTSAILLAYEGKSGFAAEKCDTYTSVNLQKNYLGAYGEWYKIKDFLSEFEACMEAIGGVSIYDKYYYTSSQDNSNAYVIRFEQSGTTYATLASRTSLFYVRPFIKI